MNNYKFFLLLTFLIVSFKSFSQTVINTESNLNKIDSTFHLFIDGMGDYKKGNQCDRKSLLVSIWVCCNIEFGNSPTLELWVMMLM